MDTDNLLLSQLFKITAAQYPVCPKPWIPRDHAPVSPRWGQSGTFALCPHCRLTTEEFHTGFSLFSPTLNSDSDNNNVKIFRFAVSTLLRGPTTPEKLLLACVRIWQIGGGSGNLHWPARWRYHLRSLGIVKNFITNFDPSLPPRVKGAGVGVSVAQCCPMVTCAHRTALLSNNLSSEARWRLLCHTDSFFQGGNGRNTVPNTE